MRTLLSVAVVLTTISSCGDPAPSDGLMQGAPPSTNDTNWPDGLTIEDARGENDERCPIFGLDGRPLLRGDPCVPANLPPEVLNVAPWPRDPDRVYSLISLPAEWSLAEFSAGQEGAQVFTNGLALVVLAPAQFGPEVVPTGTLELVRSDGTTASCELAIQLLDCR